MSIWKKLPENTEPDRLGEIAAEKIDAAERFSAAIAQAGEAAETLFKADRAFLAEWQRRHGGPAYSPSRLLHQFRAWLLQDFELSAPELLAHLSQPRQSRARAETVAALIRRQTENDLAAQPASTEEVT